MHTYIKFYVHTHAYTHIHIHTHTVLEIAVGHRTFPTKIADCLNNFGFGRTKFPGRF